MLALEEEQDEEEEEIEEEGRVKREKRAAGGVYEGLKQTGTRGSVPPTM